MSKPFTAASGIRPGKLVFTGTQVPVRNLFNYLDSGETLDAFLRAFPTVSRELALGVLKENARLLAALRTAIEKDASGIAKAGIFARIWEKLHRLVNARAKEW
jgi:uncharacterized protein (DUF433 family)